MTTANHKVLRWFVIVPEMAGPKSEYFETIPLDPRLSQFFDNPSDMLEIAKSTAAQRAGLWQCRLVGPWHAGGDKVTWFRELTLPGYAQELGYEPPIPTIDRFPYLHHLVHWWTCRNNRRGFSCDFVQWKRRADALAESRRRIEDTHGHLKLSLVYDDMSDPPDPEILKAWKEEKGIC